MNDSSEDLIRIAPIWIIAFSGHRPKDNVAGRSGKEIEACRDPLTRVLKSMQQQASQNGGSCELHCCLSEGADLLAIEVAEHLNMPVHIVLPSNQKDFAEDFRNEDGSFRPAWDEAERHIAKARDPNTEWTFRIAASDSSRPECYHDTGLQMLESADALVAIWDGINTESMGGTWEVVAMASEKHLRIPTTIIDPTGGGEVTQKAGLCTNGPSESWLDKINTDLSTLSTSIDSVSAHSATLPPIQSVVSVIDGIAGSSSTAFKTSLKRSIWLHFCATVLATITASYAKVLVGDFALIPKVLTAIELVLVVYAFWLVWQASRRHQNSRWRRTRLSAQIADSIFHSAGLVDPLQPVVVRHDELWKRFALSIALVADREKNALLTTADETDRLKTHSENYFKLRLAKQLNYFREECGKANQQANIWANIAKAASFLAMPAILGSLLMKIFLYGAGKDWTTALFVFGLPILLPLIAGLASSLLGINDAARRSIRYKQVSNRLEKYSNTFSTLETKTSTQRVILEIEDILLDEMIEWHATAESMAH